MVDAYSKAHSFPLVGVESAFNTPVSPTKDLGIVSDWNSDENNNVFQIPAAAGTRELSGVEAGQYEATIPYNGSLNSGAIFELMFNQATDTATSTDYKHTFIDDDGSETLKNDLGSFTFQENHDSTNDQTSKFGGCGVNSLSLTIELNSELKVSGEVFASGHDTGTTAGTRVTTTTRPLIYVESSLSFGVEASEATVTQVQSFSIDMVNNLERVPAGLGARNTAAYVAGLLELSGEFTKIFDSKVDLELFLGGASEATGVFTKNGLIFEANNGVALGSGRREFYVRVYGALLETKNKVIPESGPVEITFAWRGTTLKDLYMVDQVASYF